MKNNNKQWLIFSVLFMLLITGRSYAVSIVGKVTHSISVPSSAYLDNNVTISWSPLSTYAGVNYSYYKLGIKPPNSSSSFPNKSSTSYTFKPNVVGSWCFKVRAVSGSEWGAYTSAKCVTVSLPPAPGKASPLSSPTNQYQPMNTNVTLAWPNVTNATSYILFEGGSQVYSGSSSSTVRNSSTYGSKVYTVQACNDGGCGTSSSGYSIYYYGAPGGVNNLTASTTSTEVGNDSSITWTAPGGSVPGVYYDVYVNDSHVKTVTSLDYNLSVAADINTVKIIACNPSNVGCGGSRSISVMGIHAAPGKASPLSSPTNQYQPMNTDITLTWPSISGATSHKLFEDGTQAYSGANLSTVRNSSTYGSKVYTVQACNDGGCGTSSSGYSIYYYGAPGGVNNLTASTTSTEVGNDSSITWTAPGGSVPGVYYDVYVNDSHVKTVTSLDYNLSVAADINTVKIIACNPSNVGCGGSRSIAVTGIASPDMEFIKGWNYPDDASIINWTDVTSGDFNGDGIDEIALLKPEHNQLIFLSSPHDQTYQVSGYLKNDIELVQGDFIAITSGNFIDEEGCRLDSSTTSFCQDEVAILRNVTDGGSNVESKNVLIYQRDANNDFSLVASRLIETGDFDWVDITAGDFDGNGVDEIVVVKKEWSQFMVLSAENAVPGLSLLTSKSISNSAGNDWRAITAGDFNNDGRDELLAVRQGNSSTKDIVIWDLYANGSWDFVQQFQYNHDSTNYDWQDVASGNFDGDNSNGDEFVLYKHQPSNFIYYVFNRNEILGFSYDDISTLGSSDYSSNSSTPWSGIAAGNMILNNNADELVSIRSRLPGSNTIEMYANNTHFTTKKERILDVDIGGGKKVLAAYAQNKILGLKDENGDLVESIRDGDGKLNVSVLHQFLLNNNIKTFNFLLSDSYARQNYSYNPIGKDINVSEYISFIKFLEVTKEDDIKVWVTLIPDSEAYTYYGEKNPIKNPIPTRASFPGDSEEIFGDESSGFNTRCAIINSKPELNVYKEPNNDGTCSDGVAIDDPLNFTAWFGLLGKVATKYPHLVAINIDDFAHNKLENVPSPAYLGKMLKALRRENQDVAFIPTNYWESVSDNYAYIRNYTDGFLYYFNSTSNQNIGLDDSDSPDLPYKGTKYNMHGNGTLNVYDIEIPQVRSWLNNSDKLLITGNYVTPHSQSTTRPTANYVEAMIDKSVENSTSDGAMIYLTPEPDSEDEGQASIVYSKFREWQ